MGYVSLYVGKHNYDQLNRRLSGIIYVDLNNGWIRVANTRVDEVIKRLDIKQAVISYR